MAELNFYRGIKAKYSEEEHKDGIYFATDKHEIILNGSTYGLEIDDELLSNSTNPATGRAIYSAIQSMVSDTIAKTAIGSKLVLVKQGNTYKVELYDSRTETLLSQTTGFIGGEGTSDMSGLSIQWLHGDLYVRDGQTANVRFKYDVLNSSGYSTGTPGKVRIQILNTSQGTVLENGDFERDLEAGKIFSEDITGFLIEGSSITVNITVSAVTPKGEQTEQYSCKAFKVSLKLVDEGFNIATITKKGDTLTIPYKVQGSNVSTTTRCYLDGVHHDDSTKKDDSFTISTNSLTHGSHSIQLRSEYKVDEITTIYSNTIYYDVIIYEEGNFKPIVATRFEYEDGSLVTGGIPYINIEQYDSYELPYAVYDPSNVTAQVEFFSGDDLVGVNNVLFSRDVFSYRYNSSGNKLCSIKCGITTYDYRINVQDSSLNIEEPTSGMQLYLDAYGKSNNSDSKNSWTYKDITTVFEGVNFGGDGWRDGALRLMNGGSAVINYQPLKTQSTGANNAFTFSIKFKVTNVIKEDEVIVDCTDEYGTGFIITTQEAKFITNGGKTVSTKFAAGEVYNIGFVSYPVATETSGEDTKVNTSMIYLYINGILSACEQRDTVDNIYQTTPQNIKLKAENCTLDIYSIRAYNTQLTDEQMFACYLIDLGDSVAFKNEYSGNDILDFNNNISIASIYGKIPYVIVTGKQLDGQATLPYVAVVNDKDPKYDVDSILYVDGAHPEFNFMCTPGEKDGKKKSPQIRLQGTSSLAYPRKNYRLYTKDATLYVGCDADGNGGTLAKKSKYSMSETAAPVNCFCLKADYAESSSSHNTGMANMVNDVLAKAGDLTPAQKYVNKEVYPYEVRTTVEGHPCLLFYRANPSDTPIFAGKFNFNNDKSTEAVFGFLDIDGYHKDSEYTETMAALAQDSFIFPEDFDSVTITDDDEISVFTKEDIIDLLGGNPTECWEFKNNNNRMGVFKEADFDKKIVDEESGEEVYSWVQMWEARFPDEDAVNACFEKGVKPKYLMRTAQWLHSTDTLEPTEEALPEEVTYGQIKYTHDTAEYRAAKFKNELKDYFDVKFLCDYYILNDCVAGVDQRVKNMMWGFWYDPTYTGPGDGVLCYPIYYDNDTILGVRNDGRNVFYWDIDEESLDPTADPATKSYAFAGHDSVLWKNLREQCSKELSESYQRIRKDNMTNARMYYFFDDTQSGKFCERIYNKDATYKYIIPKTQGVEVTMNNTTSMKTYNYTFSAQGDRKAHRHWFITNRMDLFDAKYNTGSFTSSFIQIKGPNKVDIAGNQEFKATAARNYYFHVRSDEAGETHKQISKGETWTYVYDRDMSEGSTFYFTGCNWMSKLDLSNWKGALALDIPNMPVLEELIIGNSKDSNQGLADSPIKNNMPLVKKISVLNYKSISSFDFSYCNYLEKVDLTGCDNTTIAQFAKGGNINEIYFPKNYQKLILQSLPKITYKGLHFENLSSIRSLNIENCPQIDALALLETIFNTEGNNLRYVRITGIDLTGSGEDLIKYYKANLGGITSEGNDVPDKCYLIGKYRLTTLLDDTTFKQLQAHFPELIIEQPKYTTITLYNKEKTPEKISNYDNQTGYEFGNDYLPSGHISKILEQRHSYLVKKVSDSNPSYNGPGTFAACRLSEKDSYYYYGDEVHSILNGSQGDFCLYEPHYWYKGVNDHSTGKIYAFFSTLSEVPTIAEGIKITASELTQKKNFAINATDLYNNLDNALTSDSAYITYKYTFPEDHDYKRVRVMGVASNKYGCIVCDKSGKTIKRSLGGMATSNGMFNGSYLWFDIPQGADTLWFTVSADNTYNTCDYVLYLTPSLDIEDLEPDWVEHKESFIGRILTAPDATGESISAFVKTGEYPAEGTTMSIANLCKTISDRGAGYYPFDYEAYREVFMLGYLSYGTTYLQGEVGQGRQSNGEYKWSSVNQYFPNPLVNYAKEGEKDTKRITVTNPSDGISYSYVSIYSSADGVDNKFPAISTMMGYHQFIANGGTISVNDFVDRTNSVLKTRLRNKVKIFSIQGSSSNASSYKHANFIQGGRYLDILGVGENDVTYNSENTGYCLSEIMEASSASTAGYLICGYQGYSGKVKSAACLRVSESTSVTMTSTTSDFDRVLRVLIVPNNLIICDGYDDFRNYLN